MGLYLKPGVDLRDLQPQTLLAFMVADEVYADHGLPCRITSVYRDGSMLHTEGFAVDLGLRDGNGELYADDIIDSLVDSLKARIGKPLHQFDVVDERTAPGGPHIHIEFDPR